MPEHKGGRNKLWVQNKWVKGRYWSTDYLIPGLYYICRHQQSPVLPSGTGLYLVIHLMGFLKPSWVSSLYLSKKFYSEILKDEQRGKTLVWWLAPDLKWSRVQSDPGSSSYWAPGVMEQADRDKEELRPRRRHSEDPLVQPDRFLSPPFLLILQDNNRRLRANNTENTPPEVFTLGLLNVPQTAQLHRTGRRIVCFLDYKT